MGGEVKHICDCKNINSIQVEEAVKDGAHTFEQLQAQTQITTGCGGCIMNALQTFKEAKAKHLG